MVPMTCDQSTTKQRFELRFQLARHLWVRYSELQPEPDDFLIPSFKDRLKSRGRSTLRWIKWPKTPARGKNALQEAHNSFVKADALPEAITVDDVPL